MKRHLIVGLPAALFLLSMVASVSADPPTKANNPLVLKEQGNFYVGGRIELRSPNTTNAALPGDGTAAGHIAVYQANVQYQIPVAQKYKYPIVLMHGGGHTANILCQPRRRARVGLPVSRGVGLPSTPSMDLIAVDPAGIRPLGSRLP